MIDDRDQVTGSALGGAPTIDILHCEYRLYTGAVWHRMPASVPRQTSMSEHKKVA